MSEIQNRAVRMLQQNGLDMTVASYRVQMLKAALALYRSTGGTEQVARELCAGAFQGRSGAAATGIGDAMIALAAVSHLSDLDMMQAAYNELDRGGQELSEPANAG